MRLIDFEVFDSDGKTTALPVNPDNVNMVIPFTVPGKVAGPGGDLIGKGVAALDFGIKVVPVDCSVDEAKRKLLGEGK